MKAIQAALDPYCLLAVHINPESSGRDNHFHYALLSGNI